MNLKFSFKNKYLLLALLPIIFLLVYWLKFQTDINFFDSFSIGSYFPFKYLKNDVIESPEPGVLLSEDFNKKRLLKKCSVLWMREKGTVIKELSKDGFKDSGCLLIKNISSGSWTYSHNKKVKVNKGDLFYMKGLIKMTGDKLSAYLSVAAFDKNSDVIDWNLIRSRADRTGEWIKVEKQFVISDDIIRYIRFRLVGEGNGEYRFDNIIFRKLN